jgi:hypothetical protein
MTKKYVCYWGEGYSQETQIVNQDFFFNLRGYEDEDIQAVADLALGGVLDFTDLSGTHYVLRVE